MKKKTGLMGFVIALVIFIQCIPTLADDTRVRAPVRMIHVVYDDSGSMINTGAKNVDTWCQAKYAMEVFAAMLEEKDTMNIYYMSDFNDKADAGPKISLRGKDGKETNVSKIHNTISAANNTPFAAVRKACSDLAESKADEKWLVVLTDGEFQGIQDINGYFAGKSNEIKVMFLGMGPDAATISSDAEKGIFFAKAGNSNEILGQITGICNQIFNSDNLDVNASEKTVAFDVPMSELTVFAQGKNVSINGIVGSDGKKYKPSANPVVVQYSEKAASNYADYIVDRSLKGSVTTFGEKFPAGEYSLNVSGADTIEIYYKPDIEATVYLTDYEGNEVSGSEKLKAGEYKVDFGFIKIGTSEKVSLSPLLGEVSFEGKAVNGGEEKKYSPGDTISVEEGALEIDVTVHYLKNNSFSTHLEYSVYADKQIEYFVIQNPEYQINKDGIKADEPIQIQALAGGAELTKEQWDEIGMPEVIDVDAEGTPVEFKVKKSEKTGMYYVYPALSGKELSSAVYENRDFKLSYEDKHGDSLWYGETQGTMKVKDTRTWMERNQQKIKKGLVIFTIIFVPIFCWVPPSKKYLSGKLVKKPIIIRTKVRAGVNLTKDIPKGKFEKSRWTSICPKIPERGTIRVVPARVTGVPKLKVKAVGKGKMKIANWKNFINKDYIEFDGEPLTAKNHKKKIDPGTCVTVVKDGIKYSCTLDQSE